jgi:hypothetical protein
MIVIEALIVVGAAAISWLGPAWLVAMYAERKGYSFGIFLLLGLFVSWLVALVLALLLKARPMRIPSTRHWSNMGTRA